MGWARFDDGYSDNPKVLELSALAELLDVRGIIYCAKAETDGYISVAALKKLSRKLGRPEPKVVELVMAGRWTVAESSGWYIHDYLKFNPSKAEREEVRVTNKERQRKWRSGVTNALVTYGPGNKEKIDACESCDAGGWRLSDDRTPVIPPVRCNHEPPETVVDARDRFGSPA